MKINSNQLKTAKYCISGGINAIGPSLREKYTINPILKLLYKSLKLIKINPMKKVIVNKAEISESRTKTKGLIIA